MRFYSVLYMALYLVLACNAPAHAGDDALEKEMEAVEKGKRKGRRCAVPVAPLVSPLKVTEEKAMASPAAAGSDILVEAAAAPATPAAASRGLMHRRGRVLELVSVAQSPGSLTGDRGYGSDRSSGVLSSAGRRAMRRGSLVSAVDISPFSVHTQSATSGHSAHSPSSRSAKGHKGHPGTSRAEGRLLSLLNEGYDEFGRPRKGAMKKIKLFKRR